MKELVNRRIWHKELGLCYFCSVCGSYKPEKDFYKNAKTKWGVQSICKIHSTRKEKDNTEDDNHLKFTRITEEDFLNARKLLNSIGYITSGTTSVYEQFMNKYNLKP